MKACAAASVPLKQNVDKALASCPASAPWWWSNAPAAVNWVEGRDLWYHRR
jgi:acetyl-CoA synthetase